MNPNKPVDPQDVNRELINKNYKEVWLPILGYEGLYDISSDGRVCTYYKLHTVPRIMALVVRWDGYLAVNIVKNGTRVGKAIHTLVLSTFLSPREDNMVASHLNDIKTDNRLCNLAWETPHQNKRRSIVNGSQVKGERSPQAAIKEIDVRKIRELRASGLTFVEISKLFNVGASQISNIFYKRSWAHVK